MNKISLNKFGFIYIDGNKQNYLEIFRILEKKISEKTIVCFDDALYHGDIFNIKTKTNHGAGVKRLINYLEKNKQKFSTNLIPISNGTLLITKL